MNWQEAILDVLIFWGLTTPHEFAHAWVATKLGDDTPEREGRVTLNPLAHVDWIGTVALPLMTSLFTGGFLGWGKPVNTNPAQLRGGMNGLAIVAMAGPAANVIMALMATAAATFIASPDISQLLIRTAYLSLFLAVFNLMPVPPLDGSKLLLLAPLPPAVYAELSRFGFIILIVAMSATGLGLWMNQTATTGAIEMLRLFGYTPR